MNIEDIKVGESYNVYGRIGYKNEDEISITFECKPGVYCSIPFAKSHASMYFSPAPTPPKHDPCRLFKKGDKVRVVEWNGRHFHDRDYGVDIETGCVARIYESEKDDPKKCAVKVVYRQYLFTVPTCFLELVTPVEEIEPYTVWDTTFSFNVGAEDTKAVFYYGTDMSTCPYTKEQAKAAAEAERDRLNTEWRKEQNNDK